MNRRQALKSMLAAALETAGAAVLATSAVQAAAAAAPTDADVQQRADALAADLPPEAADEQFNTSYYPFRNFRNGGFGNGPFRNGFFRNGGFGNGGFRNFPFRNGGFGNGGFRNFPFRNFY